MLKMIVFVLLIHILLLGRAAGLRSVASPLSWLSLHKSKIHLSWEVPSSCVKAYKQQLLAPVQKAACKRNLALMPVVVTASRRISDACQETFNRDRWNCSSIDTSPRFGQDLIRGTREQAYVSSLSAAGIAVYVSRACAEGRIRTCGCGKQTREPPSSDFNWGGCADNVGYGVKAAKAFTSEPFDRRKFKSNVDIRLHRHNSRVGWRAVRSSWRLQCKCHGVSGSCELKTCWKSAPTLMDVSLKLKLKHRDAEEVHSVPVGRRNKLLPIAARFNKDDLVYTVRSPDYCTYDIQTGSLGTKGRECDGNSTDSFGCEHMCCSRGYLTSWDEVEERCGCKFQRCCYVTCKTCQKRTRVDLCL